MFYYILANSSRIIDGLVRHLYIIAASLPISVTIGVAAGILISRNKRAERIVIGIANILMTIPSLALFGFAIIIMSPLGMGIGVPPAIFALVIYSFLPITRNTVLALHAVPSSTIEAARGMGMTPRQILRRIQLPLAIPLLMAGIRNACVMGVSVTTIAYLVGAGGMGHFIFAGMTRTRLDMVLAGAVIVAVLGIATNYLLVMLERAVTPRGLMLEQNKE